jgi:hypothetical protein
LSRAFRSVHKCNFHAGNLPVVSSARPSSAEETMARAFPWSTPVERGMDRVLRPYPRHGLVMEEHATSKQPLGRRGTWTQPPRPDVDGMPKIPFSFPSPVLPQHTPAARSSIPKWSVTWCCRGMVCHCLKHEAAFGVDGKLASLWHVALTFDRSLCRQRHTSSLLRNSWATYTVLA